MRQGWLGNSQHTGPMVRTTPTLCNDVAFPSYRKYSQALTVGTWVEIVRCGFFQAFLFFVCLPPRLEWTFVLSTTTTIQLPSTWLTHMECAKVPKIKLNCLDVSVSDISECLWGLSPASCLPCLIYAYRIDSFCCPLEKRDKCQIYKDGKKRMIYSKIQTACTMCVCIK